MRADAVLAAAEALPVRALTDLVPAGGIVVVAPHPDDESLGCGGLIAEACARSVPVRLVVVSDGIGSHPNSPSYPPERLRLLRESETLAAVAHLGLSPHHVAFLRLPDRFVPATGPKAEAAAGAIAVAIRATGAGALFVTWEHDPHCDHAASAALARRARDIVGREILRDVRLYAYPVWGWTLPPESEIGAAPRGARLDIARHLPAKAAAIAAHRSQTTDLIADDPAGFRLEPAMLARFAGDHEIFWESCGEEIPMTRHTASLPPDYFDARYAADPDPWNFAASPYERDKYAATLAALPRPHYAACLEIGCSIGVLTAALAPLCDTLTALDVAEAALDQARARCRDLPHVRLLNAQVPGAWPDGRFDLILLSEVVYYLDAADVARLASRIRQSLLPGGDVVLVHWTGETHYPLTGDEAADLFIRETDSRLAVAGQVRTDAYRLDMLRDRDGVSPSLTARPD